MRWRLGAAPADAATPRRFRHGVASGDPHPTSVILWTRVTPTAAATPGSGRGPRVSVRWQVARDAGFRHVVKQGTLRHLAARDHTVKLEARGLRPATTYYYRFSYDGSRSRTGRTRTAPATTSSPRNLRFGIVSCANLQAGYFSAYRHLAGAPTWTRSSTSATTSTSTARASTATATTTATSAPHGPRTRWSRLADYRQRHAQYKTDPDLADLHARCRSSPPGTTTRSPTTSGRPGRRTTSPTRATTWPAAPGASRLRRVDAGADGDHGDRSRRRRPACSAGCGSARWPS